MKIKIKVVAKLHDNTITSPSVDFAVCVLAGCSEMLQTCSEPENR